MRIVKWRQRSQFGNISDNNAIIDYVIIVYYASILLSDVYINENIDYNTFIYIHVAFVYIVLFYRIVEKFRNYIANQL